MSAPAQISEAQLAANRANAQLSTGARTDAGKAKVSLNAVKTGLTGRNAFLPTDDAAKYQALQNDFYTEFKPVGVQETSLVQSLVDTRWRLDRINGLEQSAFNYGFKRLCEERPELIGTSIEGHEFEIMKIVDKDLRNLQIQDARLGRRFEKELKLLHQLQSVRRQREEVEFRLAAEMRLLAEHRKQPFVFEKNGFVFSKARFEELWANFPEAQKQYTLKRVLAKAA